METVSKETVQKAIDFCFAKLGMYATTEAIAANHFKALAGKVDCITLILLVANYVEEKKEQYYS